MKFPILVEKWPRNPETLTTMPLTRRHFLKASSAGLLSLAGFPLNAYRVPLPSAPDTFDLGSLPRPRIIVMGVGGGGLSVVSALMKHSPFEVAHMCVDTDAHALKYY